MPKTILAKLPYDVAMGTEPIESLLDAYPDRVVELPKEIETCCEEDKRTVKAFAVWCQLANEGRVKEDANAV